MNENEDTRINNEKVIPIKRNQSNETKTENNNQNVVLNNQNLETKNTINSTYNNQGNNVTPNIISIDPNPQISPYTNNNSANETPKKDNNNNSNAMENNKNIETPNNENNNSSQEKEKSNTLEIGLLVIFIISIIAIILRLTNKITIYSIIDIYLSIIIYLGYKKAKEKKEVAVKYGIGIGILLLLTSNTIFGIFTIVDAINYNRKFKGMKKPKKEWLTVLYIIGIYFALILLIVIINITGVLNPRLKCTRNNGDKVVYRFNEEGIRNMTINGKRDEEQAEAVNSLYRFKFYLQSYEDEPVKEYIAIIKEYEEDAFGSSCE